MKSKKRITAEQFDKLFDEGKKDVLAYCDLSTTHWPNLGQKRVNVDFPAWVIDALDNEAARIGVTRQSIIKVWLVERLQLEAQQRATISKPSK